MFVWVCVFADGMQVGQEICACELGVYGWCRVLVCEVCPHNPTQIDNMQALDGKVHPEIGRNIRA